ncbi:MAG: flagellar basal body L-ring protein FlgH [Hyphomicrobiaceae bacterium]|nr:flagellar basal body L-ring protein FlgH [Hyphomicrobiaceae bacterium]
MRPIFAAVLGTAVMGACAVHPADIGREPHLTPVGAGLRPDRVPILGEPPPPLPRHRDNSLWEDAGSDLFRDPRARRIGDVVTVTISIKDRASLDNTSNRTRNSNKTLGLAASYGVDSNSVGTEWKGDFDASVNSRTTSKGEGAISRSESIQLLVAAVVSEVLPNGNMVISGSQEVRVNFEVRVLSVAGVVRPRDIATDNTVSYEKIAEARISYGGRGRITEVQQPGLGQQLLDLIVPF